MPIKLEITKRTKHTLRGIFMGKYEFFKNKHGVVIIDNDILFQGRNSKNYNIQKALEREIK